MSSNIRIERVCQFCGEVFIAKTTVTKFCGDPCAKRAYKLRKRNEKIHASNKETAQIQQAPINQIKTKELLSIQDAMILSGLSRTTIWRLIHDEKLKGTKIGRRVIIKRTDLNQLFL